MYGKIFQQIYDGTLREDPMVRLVFMDMIILSDRDGHIDVTPEALSARTNVPLDVVLHAIKQLESEDLRSRSSKENGARIVLLDSHRDWGWKIVNHKYYRELLNAEDRRKKARDRKRKQRERERQEGVSRDSHAPSRISRHTDTDTDTDTNTDTELKKKNIKRKKVENNKKNKFIKETSKKILDRINELKGSRYRDTKDIEARLKDGATIDDCMLVIENKYHDPWFRENPKYFKPSTLFKKSHFDDYINDTPQYTQAKKPQTRNERNIQALRNVIDEIDREEKAGPITGTDRLIT